MKTGMKDIVIGIGIFILVLGIIIYTFILIAAELGNQVNSICCEQNNYLWDGEKCIEIINNTQGGCRIIDSAKLHCNITLISGGVE